MKNNMSWEITSNWSALYNSKCSVFQAVGWSKLKLWTLSWGWKEKETWLIKAVLFILRNSTQGGQSILYSLHIKCLKYHIIYQFRRIREHGFKKHQKVNRGIQIKIKYSNSVFIFSSSNENANFALIFIFMVQPDNFWSCFLFLKCDQLTPFLLRRLFEIHKKTKVYP